MNATQTASTAKRKAPDTMMNALERIERRQDDAEKEAKDHRGEDARQFAEIRKLIGSIDKKLSGFVDEIGKQVEVLNVDKIKATTRAEVLAEVATPKPWVIGIAYPAVAAILAAMISGGAVWIGHDIWEGSPRMAHVTTSQTVETPTRPVVTRP